MGDALIRWSLRNRVAALAVAAFVLVYGAALAARMPVDVLPDINAPTVTVITEAHGMAPDEVETLVTLPLETSLNGVSGLRRLRSSSGIGISVVWAEFDWDTDPWVARQVVSERIQVARGSLPDNVAAPLMAPMSSIMGEIMFIGLTGDEQVDPMELRDLAEWDLRRRLLGIPGIAQVSPIGGALKQIQVVADTEAMRQLGVGAPGKAFYKLRWFTSLDDAAVGTVSVEDGGAKIVESPLIQKQDQQKYNQEKPSI